MLSKEINDFPQKNEKEILKKEEELIIKYTNEIKNETTRTQAIENLYKLREKNNNIAIYLWYSRGTMAALLQEIINTYQYLNSSKLTTEKSNNAKYIISLFQIIALNSKTRKEFLDSQLLVFLYPFLSCTNKTKPYEVIKVTSLSVIAALVKIDDSDVINFLIKTEIIPVILRIMEKSKEIMREAACFIIQRIIEDINGLKYMCEIRERLIVIIYILNVILENKLSFRLLKNVLKIYLGLIENKEAKKLLKQKFPQKLKDKNFIRNLDDSSKVKVEILLKSLEENEAEIIKLKNDLTNKNNNNIQNINIINNNNINIYNNGNQINLNNNDINNNNTNMNMIFVNNLNQMQPRFMITSPVGDYNFNAYNDNDNYMNQNIYNQNSNNGLPNINFYKTFKNI